MKSALSSQSTNAIKDVINNYTADKSTAKHKALKQTSIETLQKSCAEIKDLLSQAGSEVDLVHNNISFQMGKWCVSGNIFSHIWGSFYPVESGKISAATPQLYIIRKEDKIEWGLSLSSLSQNKEDHRNEISNFFKTNSGSFDVFINSGFKFEISPINQRKNRLFKEYICSAVDASQIESEFIKDIKNLFPIYCKLIELFRTKHFLVLPEKNDWESKWERWWLEGKGDTIKEDLKVPAYLEAELGSRFTSVKHKWDIAYRESVSCITSVKEGRELNQNAVRSLLYDRLRRTNLTGGWRTNAENKYKDILKASIKFAEEHPSGCTTLELENFLDSTSADGNGNYPALITTILCDISPSNFLPSSKVINIVNIEEAASLLQVDLPNDLDNDYKTFINVAKEISKKLFPSQNDLRLDYVGHFIAWIGSLKGEEMDDIEEQNESSVSYWSISPGEKSFLWPEWQEKSIISIGWDELNDLSRFSSQEELREEYLKHYPSEDPKNCVKCLFEFRNVLKKGDIVIVKNGRTKFVAVGEVTSDHEFMDDRQIHKNIRHVKWLKLGAWEFEAEDKFAIKTLTNITKYADFIKKIFALTDVKDIVAIADTSERYSIEDAKSEVFFDIAVFKDMLESLQHKKNILLQGPPGVGKTYVAELLAFSLLGVKDKYRVDYVQFHQSYSYEDFIQGYRPHDGGFVRKDGVFMDACRKAREHGKPHFLIIDEINRGNLSKIFGELLMLIEADKRGTEISLTYSQNGEKFSVPENLYIIGTMNTADRSLSVIDYALRRRFAFFNLVPELESEGFKNHLIKHGLTGEEVIKIQQTIKKFNVQIKNDKRNLGAGFEIGHSYFCKKPHGIKFEVWFEKILKHEIYPLLREYWFDEPDKAEGLIKRDEAA